MVMTICINFIFLLIIQQHVVLGLCLTISTLILLSEDKVLIFIFGTILILGMISGVLKYQLPLYDKGFVGRIDMESIIFDGSMNIVTGPLHKKIRLLNVDCELKDGQRVFVLGDVEKIQGGYKSYSNGKNVFYELRVESIQVLDHQVSLRYKSLNWIRNYLKRRFTLSGDLIFTMIFGVKKALDEDVIQTFNILGLTHLLVVSGLHVSIITYSFEGAMKKVHLFYWIRKILILSMLTTLCYLGGFHISIIRAAGQKIIKEIGNYFNQKYDSLSALSLLSLLVLVYNPYAILSLSYQLSFIAAFSLASMKDLIHIFRVYTGIFPIISSLNASFNLLTLPINILMISAVGVLLPMTLFISLIPFDIPCLNSLIDCIFTALIGMLDFFANLDILNLAMFRITKLHLAIYYSLFFLYFCMNENKVFSKIFNQARYILLIAGICIFLMIDRSVNDFYDECVIFIDVGNGDSVLVTHQKQHILIDAGGYKQVSDLLKALRIDELEGIFISHSHFDHYGGLKYMDGIRTERLYINDHNILKELEIRYNHIEEFQKGDSLSFGEISFEALWPRRNKPSQDENDNSQVIYMVFNRARFLFTGDITSQVEKELSLQAIDVLKVPHHGSATSSEGSFIKKLSPKLSIISVGELNCYGHPDDKTVECLKGNSNEVFMTKNQGSVMIKIIGHRIKYKFLENKI